MTERGSDSSSPVGVDPATPKRGRTTGAQLAWYFAGLVIVYVIGLVVLWPPRGGAPSPLIFVVVMFAPTVGALLARFVAGGRIQWGRPNWWILAGLVPSAAVLLGYLLGATFGWVKLDPGVLGMALATSPIAILSACLTAVGEEIGWRGFLWPTVRARGGFWRASLGVGVVWWLYHVPLIFLGWYGSLGRLPAFTVAIIGFVLFVGVITDRARSMWPSVLAHGAWNGLAATSFAVIAGDLKTPAFSGSESLLGEFGWIAAISMLLVGLGSAIWHTTAGNRSQRAAKERT